MKYKIIVIITSSITMITIIAIIVTMAVAINPIIPCYIKSLLKLLLLQLVTSMSV